MKRLLGNVVQAVVIFTIAIVAVLNSSVQNAREARIESPIPSVTVVSSDIE